MKEELESFWIDISSGEALTHPPRFPCFCIPFCIMQSRPVESGTFLIENLRRIVLSSIIYNHVGGIVTHIAYTMGLFNQLSHLVPHYGYTLIDMDKYLDR